MNVEHTKYFGATDADKKVLLLLAMDHYLQLGMDYEFDDNEVRQLMIDDQHRLEEKENYEGAALVRDTLELYNKEIEATKRIYKR